MSSIASIETSLPDRAAGTWRLRPGQAVTLRPAQAGVLRVASGGLWATADGPHRGPANARGDRVLAPGETVTVRPGERLVVEAVGPSAAAHFGWDPLTPWVARRRSLPALLWRLALVLPATALTAALWLGAAAESSRHRSDVASAPRERATVPAPPRETIAAPVPRGDRAPA